MAESGIARLVAELKRRRVFRVLLVYGAVSYMLAEGSSIVLPALELPPWTLTFVIVLLILGLPIAVVLAWAYDITPEGIQRTSAIDAAVTASVENAPAAAPPPGVASGAPSAPSSGAASPPGVANAGTSRSDAVAAAGTAASSPPGDSPENERTHLIVLPFRMLRPDPETEFLSSSLPDAISCSLAGLRSLVVRSMMTSSRYGAEGPDLTALAQHGVNAVLTGTLLRIGGQLRLTAQLAHAPEGTILWSEVTVVDLDDLFALQDELSRRVLDSLSVSLTARERMRLRRDAPVSARAYELYLRANHLSHQTGQWDEARKLYLESLHDDPKYAPAWACLGRCYRLIAKWSPDPAVRESMRAEAETSFQHAFELNPDLPIAHHFFAQLEVELGRASSAMTRLIRCLRESDADPELFAGVVHSCRFAGLLEASISAHLRARRLDPAIATSVGHTYFMLGRYDRVVDEAYGDIGYLAPLALTMLGRKADALRLLHENQTRVAGTTASHHLESLRAILEGDRERGLAAAREALQHVGDPEGRFYAVRHIARLGDAEGALAHLEQLLGRGYCCAHQLRDDPWLASVRELPEFAEISARAEAAIQQAAADFIAAGGPQVVGPIAVAA